ncbi:MAG: hypothetical protein DRQ24_11590, partial [Candidatus Latescibacterota bacterium]
VWYVLGARFDSSDVTLTRDYDYEYGPYGCSWAKNITYISLGSFAGSSTANIQDTSYDWVRIRKYKSGVVVHDLGRQNLGSKISNTGNTNFTGYLIMKVQYNNSGTWQDIDTIVDDLSDHNIRVVSQQGLDLSEIWNQESWYTDSHDDGVYRVYVKFVDPSGNTLQFNDGSNITAYYTFNLLPPPVQIQIHNISIYDVTSSINKHTYVNEFVDSGLNKTFTLYQGKEYRIEVDVKNIGSTTWIINSSNVLYRLLNASWGVNASSNIWYSVETTADDRRADTTHQGGIWNGSVIWNTSLGGELASGDIATFFFVVNITSSEDRAVNFRIQSQQFLKNDYSSWHIIYVDTTPPSLYNGIYNISNTSIFRGDSTIIYARWDETISQANVSYTTTSQYVWLEQTNTSPQNPQNWTNFTIQSNNLWYLGVHYAKIEAKDEAGNWNTSLPELNFTVYGLARVVDGKLNDSDINLGQSVRILCKVGDATNSNSAIENYRVNFYNSTDFLGSAMTNASGWAYFDYNDTTPGQEVLKCNISANLTRYYKVDEQNQMNFTLTTQETQPPYYTIVNGPSLAHKGDSVILSVYWHDNYGLDSAILSVNHSSSGWHNVSVISLSGQDAWANFSYVIPVNMTPGYLYWKQYANDSFNNFNVTQKQQIEVWGWVKIEDPDVNPPSMAAGNYTTMKCRVSDANLSTINITNYNVSFWIKNSTQSSYQLLGSNLTANDSYAYYTFSLDQPDTYTVMCNITDDPAKKYNITSQNYGTDTLTVVSGADTTPPHVVDDTYQINDTEIMRNDCILISAQWDESINLSWVKFDPIIGSYQQDNVSLPYTNNWTNYSLCTDNSWQPGNHSIKLIARDQAGNINDTLPYKHFVMYGRAELVWLEPSGNVNRSVLTLKVLVKDHDTGQGIANYNVTFYDGDLGYSIGVNSTNSSGIATLTYDFSNHNVGPDQLSAQIQDNDQLYYKVYGSSMKYNTIYLYGR